MKRILLLICGAVLAIGAAHAADITATLEPAQVEVGESAQLTVTVTGSQSAEPDVPNVPGLDIAHVGQSTQIQIVNGSITASNVQTYEVTPQRAGTFTIPAIHAGGASSRPLTFNVTGGGNASNPPAGSQQSSGNGSSQPAPNSQAAQTNAAPVPSDARFGFIQLVVPKEKFFVGELAAVDVDAFVPEGLQATVEGLPTLSSDAFTINALGNKPDREEREVNGHNYTVLVWHSAITAVKTGDHSLSMEMPLTVIVRDRQQQRRRSTGNGLFDQFFNDPFFNDPFNNMGHKKEVTIASEPEAMTVEPLPAAGRPVDFTRAVGRFEVEASASPARVMAGDPITLKMKLSGSGNFDFAASEMLPNGDGWKTYAPKSNFQADDSAGFQGIKTFEQVIVPEDPGVREIPALRFSFFNPETRRYETRTTQPIAVSVAGAPANQLASALPAAAGGASPAPPAAADLVPNQLETGYFVATLRPVFMNPWFVAGQGLPLCALAGGLLFLRRKRRFAADPRLARASAADNAIRTELESMDRAMRQHACADFFLSARSALQQRLGEQWNVRPETITLAEIRSRMNGAGDGIRPVFEMADQVGYSGHEIADADYHKWRDLVLTQLKELEKKS